MRSVPESSLLNSFFFQSFDNNVKNVVLAQVQHPVPSKKLASEIPTPQFVVVDTYERDYLATFGQPASYLRARGGTR